MYLNTRSGAGATEALFITERGEAMPTARTIQAVIAQLARRARIDSGRVSAHALRYTFALNYLRQSPGKLMELASLSRDESPDATAIYIRLQ